MRQFEYIYFCLIAPKKGGVYVEALVAVIDSWDTERGFGFVYVSVSEKDLPERVFIHARSFFPPVAHGVDLTGKEIKIYKIDWKNEKGPRAISAKLIIIPTKDQVFSQLFLGWQPVVSTRE